MFKIWKIIVPPLTFKRRCVTLYPNIKKAMTETGKAVLKAKASRRWCEAGASKPVFTSLPSCGLNTSKVGSAGFSPLRETYVMA